MPSRSVGSRRGRPYVLLPAVLIALVPLGAGAEPQPFSSRHSGGHAVDPMGRCTDPTDPLDTTETMSITGEGHASHLGPVKVFQDHCVDLAGDDPLAFSDGEFVMTSADGHDSIRGTYEGRLRPTATEHVFEIDATFVITGGTGRFEGAVGGGGAGGTTDLVTSHIELDGYIELAESLGDEATLL